MRLMTWNIQWGRGADGVVDVSRTARVARAADCDALCLQEVAVNIPGLPGSHGEDEVALLAAAFPEYQPFYAVATDLPDGKGGRSLFGNMVLSRLPVLQVFRHLLPWPSDPDVSSMQRACLEVVVESGMGPLRVMTTHLEYYSRLQRTAQVEALREIHRHASAHGRHPRAGTETDAPFAVLPRSVAAIVCGDFNFNPQAPEHGVITSPYDDGTARLADAWLAFQQRPHAPTVGVHEAMASEAPYCCDFVFVSEDLVPRIQGIAVDLLTTASDHQPVALDIRG